MLTSVLVGVITYCAVGVTDIIISNKNNTSKLNERKVYNEIRTSAPIIKKDKYDIEEI